MATGGMAGPPMRQASRRPVDHRRGMRRLLNARPALCKGCASACRREVLARKLQRHAHIPPETFPMYQAYQAHADLMWPLRTAAKLALPMLMDPVYGAATQTT